MAGITGNDEEGFGGVGHAGHESPYGAEESPASLRLHAQNAEQDGGRGSVRQQVEPAPLVVLLQLVLNPVRLLPQLHLRLRKIHKENYQRNRRGIAHRTTRSTFPKFFC